MSTTTKTLEELQADAIAAQEALNAAHEAARRAAIEAHNAEKAAAELQRQRAAVVRLSAAMEKLNDACAPVHAALVAKFKDATFERGSVTFIEQQGTSREYPKIKVPGCYIDCGFKMERYSSYRSGESTVGQIEVGTYDDKVRFPQKKDGTFSVEKIVDAVVSRINADIAKEKAQAERNANLSASKVMRERLRAEFGLSEYSGRVESSAHYTDRVKVSFEALLTEEQARVVLAAIAQIEKK